MMIFCIMMMMMRQGCSGGGATRCEDCGNQAKKECVYGRCRTCCKSKGFQCQTHIKSTWVPAYRRRPRTIRNSSSLASAIQLQQLQGHNPKRVRKSPSSSTGLQVRNFPAEVNSMATFRCFRLSSMDKAADQLAYQARVTIGGHVFKGILYDQGLDEGGCSIGESSPRQLQDPNFGSAAGGLSTNLGATTTTSTAAAAASAAQVPSLDPSSYQFPLNTFMSGTQLFLQPKS